MRHPAFAGPTGTNVSDVEHVANEQSLVKLRRDLAICTREVNNRKAMLDLRQQVAARLPRDQQWRAKQSIRDRDASLSAVYDLAVQILSLLETVEQNNRSTLFMHGIANLLQNGMEENDLLVSILQQNRPHYDTLSSPATTVQNIPIAFLLALIVIAIDRLYAAFKR